MNTIPEVKEDTALDTYISKDMVMHILGTMHGYRLTLLDKHEFTNKNEANIAGLYAEEKLLSDLLSYFEAVPGIVVARCSSISLEDNHD